MQTSPTPCALGVAGEERALKLLYLVLTSRLLARPVPVVMKGVSSSGKSYVVQGVCQFFPDSACYTLSALSEHVLIRTKESFRHRFIVIYEADGVATDFVQYLLRSLISEGHVKYLTLVQTRDGWEEMTFEKEGPTGIILTTTRVSLHPENETRMFSIPTDDSPEQTTRIFLSMAQQEDRDGSGDEEVRAPWVALQRVLETGPTEVHIPFMQFLAGGVDPSATRLRRDLGNLVTLIRAHALLHRSSRSRDERGRIVASADDYEQVYELVHDLMEEGAQASVPAKVREVVACVKELAGGDAKAQLTIARIAERMKLDTSTVRRRVRQALALGYLQNQAPDGKSYRIAQGDEMPGDREILPPPHHLRYLSMDSEEDDLE